MKNIYFDMDGTIANLYGVNGWLDDLKARNVRPYATAKSLYNDVDLLNLFCELKEKGYKQASLAVQKANYAVRMYEKVGFRTIDENDEEYIMVCEL